MDIDNRLMGNDEEQPSKAMPDNAEEYYQNSFLYELKKIVGAYVTCEFLIGTTTIVEKSGYLYEAGVNFVVLYDPEYLIYSVCDLYSLKFVNVYDTRPASQRNLNIPPHLQEMINKRYGVNGNNSAPRGAATQQRPKR